MLERLLDPDEFLSRLRHPQPVEGPRGRTRSSSTAASVRYEPAESTSKIKGGNSNWRGPIWFPTCFLLIESLRKLGKAFGPTFAVRHAARAADAPMTLHGDGARDRRPPDPHLHARRATAGARSTATRRTFQDDPHWRDLIALLRVLPRRQRRRPGRLAPDRLDGPRRVAHRRVAPLTRPRRSRPADPLIAAPGSRSCRGRRSPPDRPPGAPGRGSARWRGTRGR